MSDTSQGPGWWQASDNKWYPPEAAPGAQPASQPPQGAFGASPAGYGSPAGGSPYGAASPTAGGAQLAEWGQRVVASLIDAAMILAAFVVVAIIAGILGAVSDVLGLLVFIVGYIGLVVVAGYFYYLTGATGQSPGKALTGIKVVREADGQVLGGGGGIVRYFAHIPDGFCMIGYLFPLWDPKKQTFADKIQSTVVISGLPKRSFGPELFKA